jgi:hypothetical protein
MKRILFVILFTAVCPGAYAAQWIVAVDGNDNAAGTLDDPWSVDVLDPLKTGISQEALGVVGGDTIYLRGGTYLGHFDLRLNGSPGNLLHVRPYPGEHVVISGGDGSTLRPESYLAYLLGNYLLFEGFEIKMEYPDRYRLPGGTNAWDGLNIVSAYSVIRNLIVHDIQGIGIGFWKTATDSKLYNCIVYNNGFNNASGGVCHGIYTQNELGAKQIHDNIVFYNFRAGVEVYGQDGGIDNMHIHHNLVFDNGIPAGLSAEREFLMGGTLPFDNVRVENNIIYKRDDIRVCLSIGYAQVTPANTNAYVRRNMIIGGKVPFAIRCTDYVTTEANFIYSRGPWDGRLFGFSNTPDETLSNYVFKENNYYYTGTRSDYMGGNSWTGWRTDFSHLDVNSTMTFAAPSINRVQVSKHADGDWGKIAIMNFEGLAAVPVDLSTIVAQGSNFYIYDVEHLEGDPVVQGTYRDGNVSIPMDLTEVTQPFGTRYESDGTTPQPDVIHTPPEFGVYIIKADSFI